MVPLISIIVPVFNSQDYLRRCLDSLVNQTLNEIEIIVVDDCSTDSSREIIKEYADKFTETVIAIYRQENHKQGACRNAGLEIAQGQYVLFVDSDDWIETDACEKLWSYVKYNPCDILCFNFSWVYPDGKKRVVIVDNDFVNDADYNHTLKYRFEQNVGMIWTHLFNRQFILDNNIRFPEDIFYEDSFFNFMALIKAKFVRKLSVIIYNAYVRPNSTMRKRNSEQQYDRIRIANMIWQAHDNENRDLFLYKLLSMHASSLLYTCIGQFDRPNKKVMKQISYDIQKADAKFRSSVAWLKIKPEFRFAIKINSISPALLIIANKLALYDRFIALKTKFASFFGYNNHVNHSNA